MCGGVKYKDKGGKEWKVYFPNPKAALPVIKKDGEIEWVTWGRREEESDIRFAMGGWARLTSIKDGKWERYNPIPVKIPVQSFMEKDEARQSHWIDLTPSQALQGLISVIDNQKRAYVVTTETPPEYSFIHDRWPRIIDHRISAQIL